jgi:hypothetical protein
MRDRFERLGMPVKAAVVQAQLDRVRARLEFPTTGSRTGEGERQASWTSCVEAPSDDAFTSNAGKRGDQAFIPLTDLDNAYTP